MVTNAAAPASNQTVIVTSYTHGVPGPDQLSVTEKPIPAPGPGQALCRTLFVSLDPYLRLSLLPPETHVPTGGGPLPIGEVMPGRGVAEVVESRIEGLRPGDVVTYVTGWQAYSLCGAGDYRRVDAASPPSAALGVLGMPGFTAWSGLKFIGRPEPGQTVAVSAASGAVGSLVAQLARRWGCRSVGIAGSDEKCNWVRQELGADECVSHRSRQLDQDLAKACPDGIDVYFDNVGGDVLAAVLPNMNRHGKIVVCGRISHLNEEPGHGAGDRMPLLLGSILTRSLTVQGFTWAELAGHWDEFTAEVGPLVAAGEIRFREDVVEGLGQIPDAFGRLFSGDNFGKLVVRV
ncbi:MAG TPA: NADP-dependent oxidoreductase [Acidimicrobiales bacterium]|nr:NADP-dependent oxidoreductase [Acidimicrobiales bacterium]